MPYHEPQGLVLILLFILIQRTSASSLGIISILPLTYQSKHLTFSDWVTILTLCFAPLLVHIIAGTPEVVCLGPRRQLSWHRRLCLYNPTSILWRYFAITDRRIRARSWDSNDLAASNALFWTSRGWDGSEEMIEKSRRYLVIPPASSRASVLSKTAAKTIIVTLQGVQAILFLLGGLVGSAALAAWTMGLSIDSIFFPLAVLGLLRLCAAPWLTEDYVYVESENPEPEAPVAGARDERVQGNVSIVGYNDQPEQGIQLVQTKSLVAGKPIPIRSTTSTSYENLLISPVSEAQSRFYSTRSWRGYLFRILFLVPILFLLTVCILYIIPWSASSSLQSGWISNISLTAVLINIVYLIWISITACIFAYYFVYGPSATTVIPCIVDSWYQIYTAILLGMTIFMFIIAAIETRKTPCGTYTSWPEEYHVCAGWPVEANSTFLPFGLAVRHEGQNTTVLQENEFYIMDWNGWCLGEQGENSRLVVGKNST